MQYYCSEKTIGCDGYCMLVCWPTQQHASGYALWWKILGNFYNISNRVGRETKVFFLPIFVSFPLTPPYVPFGIRRFNLFSKSV